MPIGIERAEMLATFRVAQFIKRHFRMPALDCSLGQFCGTRSFVKIDCVHLVDVDAK